MMAVAMGPGEQPYIQRRTLCMAGSTPGLATHAGEDDFAARLQRNYQPDENNVAEQLIHFKDDLSNLEGEAFWSRLMEGMTAICHAQFAFVSKRILVDDHTTAVEMPRIGEEGSCLMAVALYYNNGNAIQGSLRDYKYHAWSCPCAYMKHDKVFLIEGQLESFIQDNPNQMAFEADAYLGVPLFAEGKCYAHFGMMWTKEGTKRKERLSWAFIEMFMHSLEDMITAKLLAGQSFAKDREQVQQETSRVIPQEAITATQSLKVYARSLSHELRTPMQGVVGMLDLMYATVQEQIEGQSSQTVRQIFQSLKKSIEVVQDSSKRAVEAADNVVHAYDLNMQVPETPTQEHDPSSVTNGSYFEVKPSMTEGTQIVNPNKRKRSLESDFEDADTNEARNTEDVSPKRKTPPRFTTRKPPDTIQMPNTPTGLSNDVDSKMTPSFRQSNIREALPTVINDSLRVGGRPEFAVTEPTTLGERIEVKTRSSNGEASSKIVSWSVEPDVPYMLPVEEKDLHKLIGAVFLNALKFTESGEIDIRVRLSCSKRYAIISVVDTGIGIPEAFQPELFKPFSKEDDAITRSTEGLGLGLMVAKGLARRLGGDLVLVRSAVTGPSHGSEFEIRMPLDAGETYSRASTPFASMAESCAARSEAPTSAPRDAQGRSVTPPVKIEAQAAVTSAAAAKTMVTPAIEHTNRKSSSPQPPKTPGIITHRRNSSTPKLSLKPDRQLASKHPLTFLVAEDNKINRKLLVQMLNTLGYKDVYEAYDGREAVRVVERLVKEKCLKRRKGSNANTATKAVVDVILMDLWMPELDGYQATRQILDMFKTEHTQNASELDLDVFDASLGPPPTVLAVSADVTDAAVDRAVKIGMAGYMSKPFKILDLQRTILEFCVSKAA